MPRAYRLSYLDSDYLAAHPGCDVADATRVVEYSTRSAAVKNARLIARRTNRSVYLQVLISGPFGEQAEGGQEEIRP
jgi:hypothetical protein